MSEFTVYSIDYLCLCVCSYSCQTEVCVFEVWDIPWQGTSTLLKQKCQPKGQLATKIIDH